MLLFFTCCTLTVPISLLNYPLSRCPKQFIGLGFDSAGILKGAKVQTYLLEKVCIGYHTPGEIKLILQFFI